MKTKLKWRKPEMGNANSKKAKYRKVAFAFLGGLLLPRPALAVLDSLTVTAATWTVTNGVLTTTGNFVLSGGGLAMDASNAPTMVIGGNT